VNANWWRRWGFLLLVGWCVRPEPPPPTRVGAVFLVDERIKVGLMLLVANLWEWGYQESIETDVELRGYCLGFLAVAVVRWPGADTEVTPGMVMALA
jgi:hypothetical protein